VHHEGDQAGAYTDGSVVSVLAFAHAACLFLRMQRASRRRSDTWAVGSKNRVV